MSQNSPLKAQRLFDIGADKEGRDVCSYTLGVSVPGGGGQGTSRSQAACAANTEDCHPGERWRPSLCAAPGGRGTPDPRLRADPRRAAVSPAVPCCADGHTRRICRYQIGRSLGDPAAQLGQRVAGRVTGVRVIAAARRIDALDRLASANGGRIAALELDVTGRRAASRAVLKARCSERRCRSSRQLCGLCRRFARRGCSAGRSAAAVRCQSRRLDRRRPGRSAFNARQSRRTHCSHFQRHGRRELAVPWHLLRFEIRFRGPVGCNASRTQPVRD